MAKSTSDDFVSPIGSSEHVLTGGGLAIPGQTISLTKEEQEDEHTKRLIAEGQLIPATEATPQSTEGGEA